MKFIINYLLDRSIFYALLYRLFQFYTNFFQGGFYIEKNNRRERSDSSTVLPVLVPIEDHEDAPEDDQSPMSSKKKVLGGESCVTLYSSAPVLVALPSFDDSALF